MARQPPTMQASRIRGRRMLNTASFAHRFFPVLHDLGRGRNMRVRYCRIDGPPYRILPGKGERRAGAERVSSGGRM